MKKHGKYLALHQRTPENISVRIDSEVEERT